MSNAETRELMWRKDINNQKNRKCTIEKLKEKEEYKSPHTELYLLYFFLHTWCPL
jgi:hypothetical protein